MKEFILLESNFNLKKIIKKISSSNIEIITFDYKSHKILENEKISHRISENYLSENDIEEIKNKSYSLTNWFQNEKISKLLTYENINIGSLFYVEFHYFLLSFLKKFLEIHRIITSNNNAKFYCVGSLADMTKQFTVETEDLGDENNSTEFLYDNIKIQLTNSFNLNFSKKNFHRLKKISDNQLSKLLKSDNKLDNQTNKIVFVEFDPIKYEQMFLLSKEFPSEYFLFNRRRPSVWNLKSYSIIKNSKFTIPNFKKILDEALKKKVSQGKKIMIGNFNEVLESNEIFEDYFSIENKSFWKPLKENFSKLCQKRILDAIEEIEISNEFLKKENFSSIVVWSENGFNEQIMISLGKKYKIPIILLQHGSYVDDLKAKDFNIFSGILPIKSDWFSVWGKEMLEYSKKCGISEKKIIVSGSPVHDKFLDNKQLKNQEIKNYILLVPTAPRRYYINGLIVEEIESYEKIIKKICQVVLKTKKQLIVKLHPQTHEHDISNLIKKIDPSIKILKQGDITKIIGSCDAVIQVGLSTVILEAQALGKPTISIEVNYETGLYQFIQKDQCLRITINDLEMHLNKIINNNEYKNEIIQKGFSAIDGNLANMGMASNLFLKFLENLSSK
tara:strand:- start:13207 stop:15057 length:1851 start_codon:yes stop_codon:yes gene_type:complete